MSVLLCAREEEEEEEVPSRYVTGISSHGGQMLSRHLSVEGLK